jgi:hypothetical protein
VAEACTTAALGIRPSCTPASLGRVDGPKVQAAYRLVERPGQASIGALAEAAAIVRGQAGRTVAPAAGSH